MDDSSSPPIPLSTITKTAATTAASSPRSNTCGNMQHPPSKTPPTSRLYFLIQTTPPLEDNSSSAMAVDDLDKETSVTASTHYGVRFQPGTTFHVQTRARPPLTPRRPRARISEPPLLGLPRKLDLTQLLYEGRDDGETDTRSWSGTALDRSESETRHGSSCAGRSHRPEPWESGEDWCMDLDTNSSRYQDNIKKSTSGISPGLHNKELGHEKIDSLIKPPESKKRLCPSAEDAGSRHMDFRKAGVRDDDPWTDEDDFWDPRVDKVSQGPTQRHLEQWSAGTTTKLTDTTKPVRAPSRLQHLLQTSPGERGLALLRPGKSSSSESLRRGHGNMSTTLFSPTSTTHWHGSQSSEARIQPFLSPCQNIGSRSASRVHSSPYPLSRSCNEHVKSNAIAAVGGGESLAAVAMQIPSSSRLPSSPNYSPLLSTKTPTGPPKYETMSLQTPKRSTPQRYAVDNEENTDWPSSPLANHSHRPDRTKNDIEDKLYTGSPYTRDSHIPSFASHHSYRSSYSPVNGEEDQKDNDHSSQEYAEGVGNATFSGLGGYMTPKRPSSSLTPPGPPLRNRNVRTRNTPLLDAPRRIRLRWSPSDYAQSPCPRKLSNQSESLPMFRHGTASRENEPQNKGMLPSRRAPSRAQSYELVDGKEATTDLDTGASTAFRPSSETAAMATRFPSEPIDTNNSSFGVRTEQKHEDISTTHTMAAQRTLGDKCGRESMSTKEM